MRGVTCTQLWSGGGNALLHHRFRPGRRDGRTRYLAAGADIFFANQRPGYLDRFGLTAEDLAEIRPGIIHVDMSLYKPTAPWSDRNRVRPERRRGQRHPRPRRHPRETGAHRDLRRQRLRHVLDLRDGRHGHTRNAEPSRAAATESTSPSPGSRLGCCKWACATATPGGTAGKHAYLPTRAMTRAQLDRLVRPFREFLSPCSHRPASPPPRRREIVCQSRRQRSRAG